MGRPTSGSVAIQAEGSVVDRFSTAATAPFVQALKSFRHPYCDVTAAMRVSHA